MSSSQGQKLAGYKLRFKDKLVSSGTKLATTDLVKKLKALHEQLSGIDQENVDTGSLKSVTRELVHNNLVQHKDKGVRALVACCIADILRLFAPEAPYDNQELKDIFDFFVRQLQHLSNTTSPHYPHYYYLLENLATVRSIVILGDLKNTQDIVSDIFKDFFDLAKAGLANNVQTCLTDIMVQLIEEYPQLPSDVIEVILAQFVKKNNGEHVKAREMAVNVCANTAEYLQRYVCQYFADVIVTTGRDSTASEEMAEITTAHELIKEINKSVPALLLNVIPQLEEELGLDDVNVRLLATQTLGEMFCHASYSLAAKYPGAWKKWLSRRNDKVPAIRTSWMTYCGAILKAHPSLGADITSALESKLQDPEEKVRLAACKVFSEMSYEIASTVVSKDVLVLLSGRSKDKKPAIRQEAMIACARFFDLAFEDIKQKDKNAIDRFLWIPQELIKVVFVNDPHAIATLEKVIHEYILPRDKEQHERTARLLLVLQNLDEKAHSGFLGLLNKQREAIGEMNIFLDLCEKHNGGVMDNDEQKITKDLEIVVKKMAVKLPDAQKASVNLSKFAKLNDRMLYKHIRDCMNPSASLEAICKALKEAKKRIEQSSTALPETFNVLLYRISLLIVNSDLVPELLSIAQSKKATSKAKRTSERETACSLLKEISAKFPAVCKNHLPAFSALVEKSTDNALVSDALEWVACLSKVMPDDMPTDYRFVLKLEDLAQDGELYDAKNATIILCHMPNHGDELTKLVKSLLTSLTLSSSTLPSTLMSLSQLALYKAPLCTQYADDISSFITTQLLVDESVVSHNEDDEDEWCELKQLSVIPRAKVRSIKVLVNYARGINKDENLQSVIDPLFKLLWQIISDDGECAPSASSSVQLKAHMRLVAAKSILRLSTFPAVERLISTPEFERLALTIQDACFQVRAEFAHLLVTLVSLRKIHVRYVTILMLAAHEPEKELKQQIKASIKRQIAANALHETNHTPFELSITRLIHLLSNHPDFSKETRDLILSAAYIDFFLDCVATPDNVSFLYFATQRVKATRDVLIPQGSCENLYVMADLATLAIRQRCKALTWPLNSYPSAIRLQTDLYKSMPPAAQAENLKINYLPREFVANLLGKGTTTSAKRDKIETTDEADVKAEDDKGETRVSKRRKVKAN